MVGDASNIKIFIYNWISSEMLNTIRFVQNLEEHIYIPKVYSIAFNVKSIVTAETQFTVCTWCDLFASKKPTTKPKC